jgi:hypothetical protein
MIYDYLDMVFSCVNLTAIIPLMVIVVYNFNKYRNYPRVLYIAYGLVLSFCILYSSISIQWLFSPEPKTFIDVLWGVSESLGIAIQYAFVLGTTSAYQKIIEALEEVIGEEIPAQHLKKGIAVYIKNRAMIIDKELARVNQKVNVLKVVIARQQNCEE